MFEITMLLLDCKNQDFLLTRNRVTLHDISLKSLSDCNKIRTHNHLVHLQTLGQFD